MGCDLEYQQKQYKVFQYKTILSVRKITFVHVHVRTAKIQISLRIRVVWTESLLGVFWIAMDAKFLHEVNEDSDHNAWMPSWFEPSEAANVKRYIFSRCGSVHSDINSPDIKDDKMGWKICMAYNVLYQHELLWQIQSDATFPLTSTGVCRN